MMYTIQWCYYNFDKPRQLLEKSVFVFVTFLAELDTYKSKKKDAKLSVLLLLIIKINSIVFSK